MVYSNEAEVHFTTPRHWSATEAAGTSAGRGGRSGGAPVIQVRTLDGLTVSGVAQ